MLPKEKFIIAEKNGNKAYFLRHIWEKMSAGDRRGWKELYVDEKKTLPPTDVVNFKEIVKEAEPLTKNPYEAKISEPSINEMKDYLQSKGIRVHPNTGEKKIKSRYYEEQQREV